MTYYIQRRRNVYLPPGRVPYVWCMKHRGYEGKKRTVRVCDACEALHVFRLALERGSLGISYD